MTCNWEGLTKGSKCRECGYELKRDYAKPPIRNCLSPWKPPEKLGDWTERQLTAIGITKDRYKEAKAKFGLAPECNCDSRINTLNTLSDWKQSVIKWWRGERDGNQS